MLYSIVSARVDLAGLIMIQNINCLVYSQSQLFEFERMVPHFDNANWILLPFQFDGSKHRSDDIRPVLAISIISNRMTNVAAIDDEIPIHVNT